MLDTGCKEIYAYLTSTVSVPAAPAGSPSAPPAHPETSAASGSDFETHPAGNAKNADA